MAIVAAGASKAVQLGEVSEKSKVFSHFKSGFGLNINMVGSR